MTPGGFNIADNEYEVLRAKYRRQWNTLALILLGIAAVGSLLLWQNWWWIAGIIALGLLVLWVVSASKSGSLTTYYKGEIVPKVVETYCPEGCFEAHEGISEDTFNRSNLFDLQPDRYHSEDRVSGRIGQTEICFAEVIAEEKRVTRTKNGTTVTYHDIFRGFFFVGDFHKDFAGQTTLVPYSWGGSIFAGKQRVKLENPVFAKRFIVQSTDQVEARYILSTSLMERLVQLSDKHGKRISVSFTGSNLMVTIPASRDHYEASIWSPLAKLLRHDMGAIENLTAIVEELNMNTRIWSKV